MSIALSERRSLARHRRALGYWAVSIGMFASLWISTQIQPAPWMHLPMLFTHLASVIAGLGATVMLDVKALRWVTGAQQLSDLWLFERSVTPLAWAGITGLLFTGAFLQPSLDEPITALKMVAVFVAAMNGVALGRLTDTLRRMPPDTRFAAAPTRLKLWCLSSAATSQIAWWTAVIIGMLNTSGA
ncbi:hypothetical protein DY023_17140 [Microbacterium bovistercoris]|uniref:DUF2269 family protein n=1 Tax=Microbacterium bovistercoris TaxID=2293570 RepID=A0A371NQX4_9MICO|nr:hypothetical protein [Microbacterium bovistercoris]REJ04035.1 hypothetical protein DY023_17140 [Microbacterium bovistercoris]